MKDQDTSQRLSSATGGGVPLTYVIALVPVASVLNVIGGTVASALKLPIFLDMDRNSGCCDDNWPMVGSACWCYY